MTIIYSEISSPDHLFVSTKIDGRRNIIKIPKATVATSLGNREPTFRALSELIASRIDEITANPALSRKCS